MDGAVLQITTSVGNVTHRITLMRRILHVIVAETMQHQRQINPLRSCDGIGLIRYEVFVKSVIAVLRQFANNTFALIIQIVSAEAHAAMESPRGGIGSIQQLGYHRILYLITYVAYLVALTGSHINRCT